MLEKQNLLGLTQSKFKDFFSDLSEKPFRTKQIMQWIYHQGVYNFGDMHNFSKDLRDKLGSIASLDFVPRQSAGPSFLARLPVTVLSCHEAEFCEIVPTTPAFWLRAQ